jgi:hypothetical protein
MQETAPKERNSRGKEVAEQLLQNPSQNKD